MDNKSLKYLKFIWKIRCELIAEGYKFIRKNLISEGNKIIIVGAKIWIEAVYEVCGRAWILYQHYDPEKDDYEYHIEGEVFRFPYLLNKNLDLTGFMVGWACNALRFILHKSPVRDGASIIIGGGDDQPVGVPPGNAEESLKIVLGG